MSAKRARAGGAWAWRVVAWALTAAITAVLLLQFWFFAHILWWRDHNPDSTSFMREQLARLRESDPSARLRHAWVPYDQIAPSLKRAVIAAEDANFTEHDGVDWDAIERAYDQNLTRGRIVRGGSTITMQLAKNLFLSGSRSYARKAQELVITYMLESMMSKDRILEIYLNVAEWGNGVFGCEAAARHYYGTGAGRLSASQSARLAAMLPRPRYYDANRGSSALARRAAIIQRGIGAVDAP
ncbi:MAG: monofunctional biosynthetic peptidoglycan transglycosylase [Burkholderiaceae bacterium]